jgi:hypothetical protein
MLQSVEILGTVETVLQESGTALPRGVLVEKVSARSGFSATAVSEVLKYAELEGHVKFSPATGTITLPN